MAAPRSSKRWRSAAAGPVDGRVVRELGVLEEASGGPYVLSGVQAVPGVQVADGGRSLARERQDLERPSLWSLGRGLLGEPFAGPGVHGPPGGVGMAAEVSLGEIADGDGSVDTDVGERPTAPFSEGGGPAVPARVVFSAMAVPHAVGSAALRRGGTRVRSDRAVEHLLGLRPWPRGWGRSSVWGPAAGAPALRRAAGPGARVAATGVGSRSAARSRLRASTKSEIFCASAAARRISRGSSSRAATQPST